MVNLINISGALENFRSLIHQAIIEGGEAGKHSIIRSSRPIQNIHDAVKSELIKYGVEPERIIPLLGNTKPELDLAGFFKKKAQDICVFPINVEPNTEILTDGFLQGQADNYGRDYTERIISINARSQISSLAKNFDTMYERTFAEALNFHIRCPKMVLGEVYMIAVPEYGSDEVKGNEIRFLDRSGTVEKYIKSFQGVNNRLDFTKEHYKYERVCLLIVDFQQTPIKIYNSDEELKSAGLLKLESEASIADLTWESFVPALLEIYRTRFGA